LLKTATEVLEALITSKTRIKLLLKFFLNTGNTSYLRDLASEFGESTNAIRIELNRMEAAGLLDAQRSGNKKIFKANTNHPLFDGIRQLLMQHTGIEHIVDKVVKNLGGLHSAYVINSFARGRDGRLIELLLLGNNLDERYLQRMIAKAEALSGRKIKYVLLHPAEASDALKKHPEALLLWQNGQ